VSTDFEIMLKLYENTGYHIPEFLTHKP